MSLLIAGLALWAAVHFVPSVGINLKQGLISRWGAKSYTVGFALLIVTSLLLIVFGWRSVVPSHIYSLPASTKPIALLLMVVAFLLFGAAKQSTRIKRVVRHPQLSSVIVWSCAHLLLNGDTRSVVLFGGMGVWAILEIFMINKRDGEWIKEPSPPWIQELKGATISIVILVVVVAIHPYIAGVPVR